MKKVFLWPFIILMIAVFSLAGCRDEAVEEVTETVKEEAVEEEVIEEEAEESETDVQDLFEACEKGNLEDVKRLLKQSADVNVKNIDGWTALMYAAYNGQTEIAEMLIYNGADVNVKNNDGWTALMYAATYNDYSE
ncbi:MAG: ankyrin repeat domain-containing protein, partial [Actinobacteria bacterium]|nr:ankyrin repeat domain-containing protein [Actinomycetota bacterium]